MEEAHAEPNYMKIFYWLLALTIVEVGVVYSHLPKWSTVIALVLMALAKAFLDSSVLDLVTIEMVLPEGQRAFRR